MNIPKLPAETPSFLWGAVAGAAALAIIGFNWGGWVTGGTAESLASMRADKAMVASLVPICVAQFKSQKAPEVKVHLAELKATESWQQGEYVLSKGWATMPGSGEAGASNEVATACAEALGKL